MNEIKRKKLEAAGWEVGTVDEVLDAVLGAVDDTSEGDTVQRDTVQRLDQERDTVQRLDQERDTVQRLDRAAIQLRADLIAHELLGMSSAEAFGCLERGKLAGNMAEPELRMLYDMLGVVR